MTGLLVNGSVRNAGVTFYTKQGKTIVRSSHSRQPKRCTRAQFDVRMRTKHTTALWQMMKMSGTTLFYNGNSAFGSFASLAFRLPVVYLPGKGPLKGGSLLLPEMPVSDGTLPPIKQWLGMVDNQAALLTNLKRDGLRHGDQLLLYTLKQMIESGCPRVRIAAREVSSTEMTEVDGTLALVGEMFSDTMTGWALVHVRRNQCSSQTAITRCRYYERYTTEEALQEAAKSYGGLTGE